MRQDCLCLHSWIVEPIPLSCAMVGRVSSGSACSSLTRPTHATLSVLKFRNSLRPDSG